jgi:membrane-bound lytic murein transglycosylase D
MDRVNPAAEVQRRVWQRRISTRAPLPAGDAFAERLKPLFNGAGIPAELVWLAEVESSFNPEATSPAGAVGLFQLMPATARSLGLSIAGPDERRHPAKSARAAATYLGQLHRRFGDWRLALAAYNAGQGRVQRALDRFKAKTFEEISPHLPAETQFYVPKFEAVLKRRESMRIEDLAPWKP